MVPAVWAVPPASLFVSQISGFLGALSSLPFRQFLDAPLYFLNELLHGVYGDIISCHMVGLLSHLIYEVLVGVSEVSHSRPVYYRRLSKVGKGFLDAHQVVGSIAALA